MLHQLDKLEKDQRKFVYYIAKNKAMINQQREYVIHVNMEKDAKAKDVFESYYFAKLLD